MKSIIVENIPKIRKNKKILEKKLNIKISIKGTEVSIDGNSENEYDAEKIIEALDFGFPLENALKIKEEESVFEIINIKDYTKKRDFARIKSRIIGTKGRTLRTLCELTKCCFEIKENKIGIIGKYEYIENAESAVVSLIRGTKHGNIYSRLEKRQPKPILDFGLKK